MKNILRRIAVTAILLSLSPLALAANVPYLTGPTGSNPANFPADIPDINTTILGINTGITAQSMALTNTFRNYLDNGGLEIQQRGTAATAGGTTAGVTTANYSADRFVVDTNVASGAGYSQAVATAPFIGASGSLKVYRNSGSLTQPVCLIQEIPTADATDFQGQSVVFSAQLQALAGLTAANNTVTVSVIYGTGSDEGLKSAFTASPAITPAWTGIGVAGTASFNTTTTWTKYSSGPILIPTTATEAGVEICFTPVGSSSGTTDGFAITQVQLEQGSVASTFENRPIGVELTKDERYFYAINEGTITAGTIMAGGGTALGTTTTCSIFIPFPVTMRVAPTYTNALTASTFKLVSASQAATALSTPFSATLGANTVYGASINFTTTGMTAKDSCELVSAAGSGTMQWSADF